MIELIREEDFSELPDEQGHKWIQLEKVARGRLQELLRDPHVEVSNNVLMNQYMTVVNELAQANDVKGVSIPSGQNISDKLDIFQLAVSRAQTQIWSSGSASYPFGRVKLSQESKRTILALSNEIEARIDGLALTEKRKGALYKRLEDFKREINQPKTRIGSALTTLAQLSTVAAMSTTALAQGPDAFATIQSLLGAEQLEAGADEMQLIEEEKRLLLPAPAPQINGPS